MIKLALNMVPPQLDMTRAAHGYDQVTLWMAASCSRNMIGCRDMILWTLGRIQETCCNQLFRYILTMCLTCSRVLTPDDISKKNRRSRGWERDQDGPMRVRQECGQGVFNPLLLDPTSPALLLLLFNIHVESYYHDVRLLCP